MWAGELVSAGIAGAALRAKRAVKKKERANLRESMLNQLEYVGKGVKPMILFAFEWAN